MEDGAPDPAARKGWTIKSQAHVGSGRQGGPAVACEGPQSAEGRSRSEATVVRHPRSITYGRSTSCSISRTTNAFLRHVGHRRILPVLLTKRKIALRPSIRPTRLSGPASAEAWTCSIPETLDWDTCDQSRPSQSAVAGVLVLSRVARPTAIWFAQERLCPMKWSQPGSNRRPPACKAGALPAELWPLWVPNISAIARVSPGCGRVATSKALEPLSAFASTIPRSGAIEELSNV
jgi:hypothetical protein